jgi:hypothetical protein
LRSKTRSCSYRRSCSKAGLQLMCSLKALSNPAWQHRSSSAVSAGQYRHPEACKPSVLNQSKLAALLVCVPTARLAAQQTLDFEIWS